VRVSLWNVFVEGDGALRIFPLLCLLIPNRCARHFAPWIRYGVSVARSPRSASDTPGGAVRSAIWLRRISVGRSFRRSSDLHAVALLAKPGGILRPLAKLKSRKLAGTVGPGVGVCAMVAAIGGFGRRCLLVGLMTFEIPFSNFVYAALRSLHFGGSSSRWSWRKPPGRWM